MRSPINKMWFQSKIKAAGLTHRQIAQILGYSNHTVVSHVLTGRRRIPARELQGWAKMLGASVREVVLNANSVEPEPDDTLTNSIAPRAVEAGESKVDLIKSLAMNKSVPDSQIRSLVLTLL